MRNCSKLAKEMARRARDRRNLGGRNSEGRSYNSTPLGNQVVGTNTFQSNIVIKEYVEQNNEPQNLFDVALCSLDLEQADSWIVDSGTAKHVTGSRKVFKSLELGSAPNAMQIASEHVLLVEGIGSINLFSEGEINMNNVFYVLCLTNNLMSVGCITDKDFVVVFDNSQCFIYKGGTREVVGRGIRDQYTSLY